MHKKTASVIHKILHFFEGAIAILTLIVLVGMLGMEVYRMFTVETYFDSINTYLHNILTLVVGLEFVRMLLDMTPANTLEVLIVAIARQVILTHDSGKIMHTSIEIFAKWFRDNGYMMVTVDELAHANGVIMQASAA